MSTSTMVTDDVSVPPAEPPHRGRHRRTAEWLPGAARAAWPALAGYAAVRAVGILVLAAFAPSHHTSLGAVLAHRSDAAWYLSIAQHGYDTGSGQSNMAFFPLFPTLVRWLSAVSPVNSGTTAVGVVWVAGVAAAWGLYAIGTHLHRRRTGVLLAVLWGVLPHAVVESMAYTEAVFTAFAAWALWAVLTRRWLLAGAMCLLAGLTRPTAAALIPVVGLTALIAAVRRQDGWRPYATMLLAPAGWLGYLGFVAHRTGRWDGWFHIQDAGWHMSFDGGSYTAASFGERIMQKASLFDFYLVGIMLIVSVTLLALSIVDRQAWQLVIYSTLVLATSLGAAGYFNAKARFVIPAFPLLLPVAAGLAKMRTAKAVVVLTALAVLSALFGVYLLLVWVNSP